MIIFMFNLIDTKFLWYYTWYYWQKSLKCQPRMWGEHKDTQYYVQLALYMGNFLITFWSTKNPPRLPKAKTSKYLFIFPLALVIVSQIALSHVYNRGS